MTFADHILAFNRTLGFNGTLPENIRIMNPFKGNRAIVETTTAFYKKYYDDEHTRRIILGINPGRFGAGVTGIPFTDTQRLKEFCGLELKGIETRELSSAFVYDVITAYGGASAFYRDYYIGAVCPLGFTILGKNGKHVNFNYYDAKELTEAVYPFILKNLRKQLSFGIERDVCFCLGTGKNYAFLRKLNAEHKFFNAIVPLEHPRFIMQYRLKSKERYIADYIAKLTPVA